MKLSLQLKLGQQLTMAPQLQQAIRLLQLSTLDLHQEIHQALESNPMLELIEGSDEEEAAHNYDFENNGAILGICPVGLKFAILIHGSLFTHFASACSKTPLFH